MEPNTRPLQSSGSTPEQAAPALSDLGRYCASVLAEVVDDGPLGVPAVTSRETWAERGRGLVIVEALTRAWGSVGNGVWWFWLPLGGDPE